MIETQAETAGLVCSLSPGVWLHGRPPQTLVLSRPPAPTAPADPDAQSRPSPERECRSVAKGTGLAQHKNQIATEQKYIVKEVKIQEHSRKCL